LYFGDPEKVFDKRLDMVQDLTIAGIGLTKEVKIPQIRYLMG
jgi:hypothetical protein